MTTAMTPNIAMTREQIVYVDFFRYCRRLRIRPCPYARWYELAEGRGFCSEDDAEGGYGPLGPFRPSLLDVALRTDRSNQEHPPLNQKNRHPRATFAQ
jgi:hypothetical protein